MNAFGRTTPAAVADARADQRRRALPFVGSASARQVRDAALPILLLAAILLFWQFGFRALGVASYLVPTFSEVVSALWTGFTEDDFLSHSVVTIKEILIGYAAGVIFGGGLGILISQSPLMRRMLTPYVIGLQSMPKVAVAPLLVVWFGQGLTSKVIVISLVTFFPLLINVTAGLRSASTEQLELMRSLTASRWQTFTKMQLPNGLPQIFAGLEIAMVLAVIGAVVGEFVGAQEGLGYFLQLSLALVNPPGMFAVLFLLALISFLLYQTVHLVGLKIVFWERSNRPIDSA
jgi:NitT/TauT family transport system permease protein